MRKSKLDLTRLPNHVAIIMDGNGTWAKRRGLPRTYGHKMGAKTLQNLVFYANSIGLKYLTVFAFSTENWKRPKDEVDYLMNMPIEFLRDNKERIQLDNIKVKVIGRRDRIKTELIEKIIEIENETQNNTGLTFIIAFDYGGQDEIIRAINKIITDKCNNIDANIFRNYLDTKDIPDVDLLIRTSGQIRISNFLLWQIAYSELCFIDTLWPDFSIKRFEKTLIEYQSRDRRFGGIK